MRRRALTWLVTAVVLTGCDGTVAEPEGLSLVAARYLGVVLALMQANSINRYQIDWVVFSDSTYAEAGNAKSTADTYDAIRSAVERLGDHHSFFQPPLSATPLAAASGPVASGPAPPARADPSGALLADGTGYIAVPAYFGGGPEGDAHAALYHGLIQEVESAGACRWVIDLRGNTGGNMWPMLAGLGPILGDEEPGAFVDPDSVVYHWFYDMGAAGTQEWTGASVDDPYVASTPEPPVAVLTDAVTASSGEAVAVAFRGRDRTRSFGTPTFGIPTANNGYELSDGALLFITFAWTADRTGTIYDAPLTPDEVIEGERTGDPATDAPLAAALGWLEGFPCS